MIGKPLRYVAISQDRRLTLFAGSGAVAGNIDRLDGCQPGGLPHFGERRAAIAERLENRSGMKQGL